MKTIGTVVLCIVVFVILSGVVTAAWWLFAPMYTARGYLSVSPPKPSVLSGASGYTDRNTVDRLVRSHAVLVGSNKVLRGAVAGTKLARTGWFQSSPDDAADRLADKICVRAEPGTQLIKVSITDFAGSEDDRTDLAEIVNAICEAYVTEALDRTAIKYKEQIGRLRIERENLQGELDSLRRTVQLAQRAASTPGLQRRGNLLGMQLEAMTHQLMQLRLLKVQAETALKDVKTKDADGTISTAPEIVQMLEMDPRLRLLREKETGLVIRRETLSRKSGEKHEFVLELDTELRTVRRLIGEREEKLTRLAIGLLKSQRETAVVFITAQLLELQQKFDEANAAIRDLQVDIGKVQQIEMREQQVAGGIAKIDERLLDLSLLAKEPQVRLQIEAVPPREITLPRWDIMILLGAGVGLTIGLLMAIVRRAKPTRSRSDFGQTAPPQPSTARTDTSPPEPGAE